jgi:hypothetical protein
MYRLPTNSLASAPRTGAAASIIAMFRNKRALRMTACLQVKIDSIDPRTRLNVCGDLEFQRP